MSGFNYAYKVLDMAKQHDSWRSFLLKFNPRRSGMLSNKHKRTSVVWCSAVQLEVDVEARSYRFVA
jgi:hypothetical protein